MEEGQVAYLIIARTGVQKERVIHDVYLTRNDAERAKPAATIYHIVEEDVDDLDRDTYDIWRRKKVLASTKVIAATMDWEKETVTRKRIGDTLPNTAYVIIEHNHGYNDTWRRGVYFTREEAEKAKPEDTNSGWEPCTYHIIEEDLSQLSWAEAKAWRKKHKQGK